jgi:hypothetical protein
LEVLEYKRPTISFDCKNGKYVFQVENTTFEQRICEFLYTYNFLKAQNPEEFLLNTDSKYDLVKIPTSRSGKFLVLTLSQYLVVREIYAEEMFRLRLEDMLNRMGIAL